MILGLTGPAGCGKSTAAAHLADRHGFARMRFAGPLKNMLKVIGLSEHEIEGAMKEKPCALLNGHSPRHAMQTLGTEWGRHCLGESFWVNLAREFACRALDEGGNVVFEDVRFANEAQMIEDLGGIVIRIIGSRGGIAGGHASEAQDFGAHVRILNDIADPLEIFYTRIDGIVSLAGSRTGLHLLRCAKGC